MKQHPKYFLLFILIILSGCNNNDEKYEEMSVEKLYLRGIDTLNNKNFEKAGNAFAEVERQHPYSDWSLNAQLMSGYSFYQAKKYDDAVEVFETFIQLHPAHEYIPYAMYMIGLCFYEQIPIIERDQSPAEESLNSFQKLINRFPTSDYAKDAKLKIDFINDHLAAKQVDIARYYQFKRSHLAAINRLQKVVIDYPTTSHVPEALYRLAMSYLALGMRQEANATAAILGHNHASSKWYQLTYDALKQEPNNAAAPIH